MTEHLNQLSVKMQGVGNTILSLQPTLFVFENKLDIFIADLESGRLLHFQRLKNFQDAFVASNPTQYFDHQQLVGFTSKLTFCSHSERDLQNFVSALVFLSSSPIDMSVL